MRILLVEDEDLTLQYLYNMINNISGIDEVVAVSNGEEAIKILNSEKKINLLITDIFMPKKNGIELINEVSKYNNIPIIIISAYNKEDIEPQFKLIDNKVSFIHKPVENNILKSTIINLILSK